jgi:hypothetical protein
MRAQDPRAAGGVEFRPVAVAKVHGQSGNGAAAAHHWRYVLRWERCAGVDLEGLGVIQVRCCACWAACGAWQSQLL